MTSIHLAWVPFALAVGLFCVATVLTTVVLLVRYPFLGRFSQLYEREANSGKRQNLRVVIVGWGSLLLGFGFSAWSLFRFTQLLNGIFADLNDLSLAEKLLTAALPFIYVLIPYHLMRFSTSMVLLAAPRDYAQVKQHSSRSIRWNDFSSDKPLEEDPGFVGLWRSLETGMTLLILFFTPSAFQWLFASVNPNEQFAPTLLLGGMVLLGSFALSIRSDRAAWTTGNIADLLLLLAKLAVVLLMLVLIATLAEVDLVEVALFTVLAVWIGVATIWGQR